MKALITGGAGFIGSHLAETLLEGGNEVVILDNLSTGCKSNIEPLKQQKAFEFIEGDVCNSQTMNKLAESCDEIFHLAAAVGVQLIADRPVHTIETNIGGTQAVLEAANKFHRKVIIASTSEVYGKSEKIPFYEDDDIVLGNTTLSRWSYACSKAIDEFLGVAFHQQFGLDVVIGRFFNTIGPKQTGKYGMVVPRFIEKALKNEPVLIYGDGQQKRCFCYVGDVVEAIIKLMESKEAKGRVYNIGSTEEITIEHLADKIIELTGSESEKKFISYEEAYGKPIDDMMRRVPDLRRIKEVIGWEAKTSLDETLQRTIQSVSI